jgi:hypothetical protein
VLGLVGCEHTWRRDLQLEIEYWSMDPELDLKDDRCTRPIREAKAALRRSGLDPIVNPARRTLHAPAPTGWPNAQDFDPWLLERPPVEEVEAALNQECYEHNITRLLSLTGSHYYDGREGMWDKRLTWNDGHYMAFCAFDARYAGRLLRFCEVILTEDFRKLDDRTWPGAPPGAGEPGKAGNRLRLREAQPSARAGH